MAKSRRRSLKGGKGNRRRNRTNKRGSKKRGMNNFFKLMMNAKKKGLSNFSYNNKTYHRKQKGHLVYYKR